MFPPLNFHRKSTPARYSQSNYFTNYPPMCRMLDHWSCNLFAFDREINALLWKDNTPEEMLTVQGFKPMVWHPCHDLFYTRTEFRVIFQVLRPCPVTPFTACLPWQVLFFFADSVARIHCCVNANFYNVNLFFKPLKFPYNPILAGLINVFYQSFLVLGQNKISIGQSHNDCGVLDI